MTTTTTTTMTTPPVTRTVTARDRGGAPRARGARAAPRGPSPRRRREASGGLREAYCGLRGISVIPLCVTAPRGGEAAPVPAVFQRLLQSSLENQCIPVIVSDVSDVTLLPSVT